MHTYTTPAAHKLAFSIAEFCKATSIARSTIYAHIAAGRLRATRIGGRTIITIDEARRFLATGE